MKFMIIRKADAESEAETNPLGEGNDTLLRDMMAYNQAMVDAGVMRGGQGLKPSASGARIQFRNGQPTVTDGPFAETKELIAGFTLIEVGSKAEALDWVRRWPASDGHGNVSLELRQLYELDDFEGISDAERAELDRQMGGTA
ncbi:MAG: YciI family protein [Comamonadaceae bacterium]|nr:MAG: YciI family protein [Comamonadaceae bacterium]